MAPIHVIGQPGAGKTTLIVDLLHHLVARNLKVGTIKHTSHAYELDKPGKDSFRHRQAGASPVCMMTAAVTAIYMAGTADVAPQQILETHYAGLDLVLIEGWISGPYVKIEVWKQSLEKPPLFLRVPGVRLIVTDDPLDAQAGQAAAARKIETLGRMAVDKIADALFCLI